MGLPPPTIHGSDKSRTPSGRSKSTSSLHNNCFVRWSRIRETTSQSACSIAARLCLPQSTMNCAGARRLVRHILYLLIHSMLTNSREMSETRITQTGGRWAVFPCLCISTGSFVFHRGEATPARSALTSCTMTLRIEASSFCGIRASQWTQSPCPKRAAIFGRQRQGGLRHPHRSGSYFFPFVFSLREYEYGRQPHLFSLRPTFFPSIPTALLCTAQAGSHRCDAPSLTCYGMAPFSEIQLRAARM